MQEATTYFVVNFTKAAVDKKYPYTIKFKGYIPVYGADRELVFEFVGSDLKTDFAISDYYKELLIEELSKDFGYGPYKEAEVKKQLKRRDHYKIKQRDLQK